MYHLSNDLIREIYLYDSTYYDKYKDCIDELKVFFSQSPGITQNRLMRFYTKLILLNLQFKKINWKRSYLLEKAKNNTAQMQNIHELFINKFSVLRSKFSRLSLYQ